MTADNSTTLSPLLNWRMAQRPVNAEGYMEGDTNLAALGAVIAEPARARILLALGDGRALAASVLADEAGIAPSTASSHLARLLESGLVTVGPQGRHRYYALAGPEVGDLIETLARLAPVAPVRSLREGTRAHALRRARTCYDHLAGRLGVALFGALVGEGLVTGGSGRHVHAEARGDRLSGPGRDLHYRLTTSGVTRLARARAADARRAAHRRGRARPARALRARARLTRAAGLTPAAASPRPRPRRHPRSAPSSRSAPAP